MVSCASSASPCQVRLISFRDVLGQVRQASMNRGNSVGQPMAPGLIIHFHGGGFVAQSSQSHEVRPFFCCCFWGLERGGSDGGKEGAGKKQREEKKKGWSAKEDRLSTFIGLDLSNILTDTFTHALLSAVYFFSHRLSGVPAAMGQDAQHAHSFSGL